MKQILQHLRTGQIEVADVPCPAVRPGHLLIQTSCTLISSGTERGLVEFGKAGLIAKARSQPDKVKQVLEKIKTDGLMPTLETVFGRLDEPLPLGYCNVGRVVEVGAGVEGFALGDRVASNGAHAEMVCVPTTLAAKVPENVDDESASFTVLGSIALHGVRLLEPTLGERFVVVGLGLVGLMAVQFLRANGCSVLGVDTNAERCRLAETFGCQTASPAEGADPVKAAMAFSQSEGADGVLITASAKTNAIIKQAADMCRKRGRIVLVGVVGLDIQRSDFYEKELSFQVSCSYGPGRYDPTYEQMTRDYPLPYVRWTVARNFEAVLATASSGALDLRPLISKSIAQADAETAYDAVLNDASALGVVMTYPDQPAPTTRAVKLSAVAMTSAPSAPRVGVIGAGNFTKLVLLPAIKAAGGHIQTVVSAGGVTSLHSGRKFEAAEASTDYKEMLASDAVNTVFITTRHNAHAGMAIEALNAGKHVFVEKPLALTAEQLSEVSAAFASTDGLQLMVGFNRRFAPHAVELKKRLGGRSEPIAVQIMANAGDIPADHWIQDPNVGGGRIIGEGCHYIDTAMFLVGSPITTVQAVCFGDGTASITEDKMSINLGFADGSIASIQYWSNGPKTYPKERVEVFSQGRVAVIDNWRKLQSYNWNIPKMKIRMDKGHKNEIAGFLKRIADGGSAMIPYEEIKNVTKASFAAVTSAKERRTIEL